MDSRIYASGKAVQLKGINNDDKFLWRGHYADLVMPFGLNECFYRYGLRMANHGRKLKYCQGQYLATLHIID